MLMRPLAHGIDLTEVARIGRMVAEHGDSFLSRCFTEPERAYAGDRKRRDEHLAARFAAKEAVLKALGTGWSNGIAWTDVEVVLLPSGQPTVHLSGRAAEVAAGRGITAWLLSLSHTETHAVASVIGTGP
jgi:holo-[acyl-carrier protein] synthase